MIVRATLIISVLLLGTFAASAEEKTIAPATNAAPPALPRDIPILEGNLIENPVQCEFAIFLLPDSKGDPAEVLTQMLSKKDAKWTWVAKIPQFVLKPVLMMNTVHDVAKSYTPPNLEGLKYFGHGLSKEQGEQLQTCKQVCVLDFLYPSRDVVKDLRSATELASQLARETNGLVWDDGTREVFTPDEWDKKRLATWQSGTVPDVSKEIVIHAYKDGDYVRAITLGMGKFGLPDVVVNGFPWSENKPMGNLIDFLCQSFVEGNQLTKRGELDLDLRTLKQPAVQARVAENVIAHGTFIAQLGLKQGTLEEGDAKNRLTEITFDRYEGTDVHARQEAMLSSLFGAKDEIKSIKHDAELLAASERARAKLPALREAFQKGFAPGEILQVKCPFDSPQGREWMWVEIATWKGDAIHGLLKNEPFHIPTLHGGQMVDVSEKDVFDFLHIFPDGHEEGNETSVIIEKMEGRTETK